MLALGQDCYVCKHMCVDAKAASIVKNHLITLKNSDYLLFVVRLHEVTQEYYIYCTHINFCGADFVV